ncbi:MAG: D-glycero-beta-D-manno-heptose 1-phosphate adenylyltransferase [Burkholderiaceae bacterium]|nr:D-glycero-beta-D-manno-heptose 1-phosphate adenylyltransferase [Burkholderiaceae bacterium]
MSTQLATPDFEKKIVAFSDLKKAVEALPHPVVLTNGVFDILHRGHVTYLAQASVLGKSLVVAINSDLSVKMLGKGDDRPINTQEDRAAVLAALESVSLVVVFEDKVPLEVVRQVQPDIYVKGGDYKIEDLPEAKIVHSYGGQVVTVKFEHERSTTALLKKVRASS